MIQLQTRDFPVQIADFIDRKVLTENKQWQQLGVNDSSTDQRRFSPNRRFYGPKGLD